MDGRVKIGLDHQDIHKNIQIIHEAIMQRRILQYLHNPRKSTDSWDFCSVNEIFVIWGIVYFKKLE